MSNTAVILPVEGDPQFTHIFDCPGCRCGHGINTNPANGRPLWSLTGTPESPTISPSVLVKGSYFDKERQQDIHASVCHSFVVNGQIQFLSDCTHHLAGQTVPLQPL